MRALFMHPRSLAVLPLVAAIAVLPVAHSQQASTAAPAASAAAEKRAFSQQDLDELLAPIALYPDALLAQVLMASTYPLEIVYAGRWLKAHPNLKGKELEEALKNETWDPAVKSLTTVPQVLTMMNEKLDWTTKLGDAVLAQQEDVMKTAQGLRKKAAEAGNLKSSPEQTVKTEVQSEKTVYIIESAKPETIYVPTYDPAVVYGPWWYPYPPPYYYYPPGYPGYYPGAGLFWFSAGIIVGGAIWGGCGWGNNEINIDIDRQNNFDRNTSRGDRNQSRPKDNKFSHNADHRKGASYRDKATAQKYNRGGDAQRAQAREQFRGRADSGRAQLSGMDRGQLQSQISAADRGARDRAGGGSSQRGDLGSRGSGDFGSRGGASASQRDFSSRGGGFSGAGNGASTRAASSRGSVSRGGGGGGRGGGGRR